MVRPWGEPSGPMTQATATPGGELAAGAAEIVGVQGRRFSSLQDDLTRS